MIRILAVPNINSVSWIVANCKEKSKLPLKGYGSHGGFKKLPRSPFERTLPCMICSMKEFVVVSLRNYLAELGTQLGFNGGKNDEFGINENYIVAAASPGQC